MVRRSTLAALLLASLAGSASAQQSFSIVLLPDTQFYCETPSWFYQFTDQTDWIASARTQRNISFVSHLGDIVQNGGATSGNTPEWLRAAQALSPLNNLLPYSICLGNHDYETVSSKTSGSSTYEAYFGSARYAGQPWYGGHLNNRSHYQVFQAGGREWLHLTLEWRPDGSVLDWAEGIINGLPDLPVIVSTHEHVRDPDSNGNGAGRSTAGQFTWDNLLYTNPRVVAIFNGHFHSGPVLTGGEYSQIGINSASTDTLEVLTDYQRRPTGGSGWLRIVQVDERNHQLRFYTYSPSMSRFETDWNSQFVKAFDFGERMDGTTQPAVIKLLFRDGEAGYMGTQDTELRQNAADAGTTRGSVTSVVVDTDEPNGSTMDSQILIKFDNIFGTAAGRVAPDSDVVHAALRMKVTNPGAGLTLHRVLTPWTEATATWNSLSAGVSANGTEAVAAPENSAGYDDANNNVGNIWVDLDVTSSLRAYMNGAANHGWALLPYPSGANAITFTSSEGATIADRPQLVVTTPTSPVQSVTFQQGANGYTGTVDIELQQSNPVAPVASAQSIAVGSDEPVGTALDRQSIIRFNDIFSTDLVPLNSFVTSAMLVLEVTDTGSGFTAHRMIAPWNATSSWSSFASDGIQADDNEAWLFAEQTVGADNATAATPTAPLMLDVTESIRAWQQGAANLGWTLRPHANGPNTLRFASSEHTTAASRPRLIVKFVPTVTTGCDSVDFNNDGLFPDTTDIDEYLSVFSGGACASGTCNDIDFNNDGLFPDTADIDSLLSVFSGGPCL